MAVWLLGLTQIVGYGTLYYGFAILADGIAETIGWPVFWVFGAFSLALLAGGLAAPFVGRQLDRHGAAKVMAVGSLLAAASLLLTAIAPNALILTAGLVAMQLASTLVLYDAAFTHLIQIGGPSSGRLITYLTLIAGLASTVFWPLTFAFRDLFTWREILVIFAGMNVLICFPVHMWLASEKVIARARWTREHGSTPPRIDEDVLPESVRSRAMFFLTWGFALSGFLLMAILAQMVPLLKAMGLDAASVLVSTLFGPAQVLIRFANMVAGSERRPMGVTLAVGILLPLAVIILATTAPAIAGAAAFASHARFCFGAEEHCPGNPPALSLRCCGIRRAVGQNGRGPAHARRHRLPSCLPI